MSVMFDEKQEHWFFFAC